jgi:hypothetical protein
MESLLGDVRYAFRSLLKSPGFALATVLTLGLGIGANTAIFSLIHGVLLAPLPYRQGERLVVLQQSAPKAEVENLAFSIKEVYDYRDSNQTLAGLVEHHSMTFTLLGRDEPERVSTGVVSAEFFDVLGITPLHGRAFRPEEDDLGADAVLILSNGYWQRAFGGDPQVVGRTLKMGGRSYTIIGVAPADYRGGLPALTPAFYVPMAMQDELMGIEMLDQRDFHSFFAKARLAPGVTPAQTEHASRLGRLRTIARSGASEDADMSSKPRRIAQQYGRVHASRVAFATGSRYQRQAVGTGSSHDVECETQPG